MIQRVLEFQRVEFSPVMFRLSLGAASCLSVTMLVLDETVSSPLPSLFEKTFAPTAAAAAAVAPSFPCTWRKGVVRLASDATVTSRLRYDCMVVTLRLPGGYLMVAQRLSEGT